MVVLRRSTWQREKRKSLGISEVKVPDESRHHHRATAPRIRAVLASVLVASSGMGNCAMEQQRVVNAIHCHHNFATATRVHAVLASVLAVSSGVGNCVMEQKRVANAMSI